MAIPRELRVRNDELGVIVMACLNEEKYDVRLFLHIILPNLAKPDPSRG